MPNNILNKVRSILKKNKQAETPSPETEAPASAPTTAQKAQPAEASPSPATKPPSANPAREAEKTEPARSRPALKEESGGERVPEPVEKARRSRAPEPEEWRPGKSGGDSRKPEASENGRNSGSGSRERQRSREGTREGSREGPKGRSRGGKGRGRKGGGGRPSGGRGGQRTRSGNRSGDRGNPKPHTTRGKGFSFPRPKSDPGDWTRDQYDVPEKEGKTRFTDLDLDVSLLHAISDLGYQYCTPIQSEILPDLLKGRDGLGQAQTGTGKTAAFLLASLNHMLRNPRPDQPNGSPRMLVLAPTRELVLQIEEEAADLMKYTPLQSLPVYGGLDYEPQKDALRNHQVDMVAATPGRLIDFMRSRTVDLSKVEILVLDEADRMLDMGFIPDVKRIVYSTPHKNKRQTLFFSATFNDDIRRLAGSWTRDPVSVVIEPENVAADTVDQTVYIVTDGQKFALTVNMLRNFQPNRTLIFANRRDTSQDLCDHLQAYGFKAALLSGAVPQAKRVKTLEAFRDGSMPIVVATDVAGRGIHVDDIGLVINYNLPEDAEDYVHRIGRTGRAGVEGRSVCFASEMDSMMLPEIEKFIGRELVCTRPEDSWLEVEKRELPKRTRRGGGGGGGRGRGGPRGGGRGDPRGGGGRGRSGGGRGRSGGGPRGGGARRR